MNFIIASHLGNSQPINNPVLERVFRPKGGEDIFHLFINHLTVDENKTLVKLDVVFHDSISINGNVRLVFKTGHTLYFVDPGSSLSVLFMGDKFFLVTNEYWFDVNSSLVLNSRLFYYLNSNCFIKYDKLFINGKDLNSINSNLFENINFGFINERLVI